MSMQKLVIFAVALLAVDAATEIEDSSDVDEVTLLQHTRKAASRNTAGKMVDESAATPQSGVADVAQESAAPRLAQNELKKLYETLKQNPEALVPKDLKPLSMEEIRRLNASRQPESALLDMAAGENGTQSFTPVYDQGVYCGSSTRFDVAGFMETSLSIDLCYVFSCVAPFVVSATCGPYFYTNGQGNCKCCDYGSNLYYSTANPPNYLYSCR